MAFASKWDELENKLQSKLEGHFGEQWRYEPRKTVPNKRPVVDQSREQVTISAVFNRPSSNLRLKKEQQGPGISTREPVIEIRADALPYAPRQHDRATRLSNGAVYEVIDPAPNGHGVYMCRVNEVGLSSSAP